MRQSYGWRKSSLRSAGKRKRTEEEIAEDPAPPATAQAGQEEGEEMNEAVVFINRSDG